MKVLAFILITGSLILGTLAAVTAYVPRLASIDPRVDVVTLNGVAGRTAEDPTVPLVDPDTTDRPIVLTRALIEKLERAGVERVRVREFSLDRWDYKGLFLLALAGLLAGALILRREESQRVAALISDAGGDGVRDPTELILEARAAVEQLIRDVGALPDDVAKAELITSVVDRVEEEQLTAFVDARPVLIGAHGLAGFAHIMDRFAASERQLYRAWSSAADGALEESDTCLRTAVRELTHTVERLAESH